MLLRTYHARTTPSHLPSETEHCGMSRCLKVTRGIFQRLKYSRDLDLLSQCRWLRWAQLVACSGIVGRSPGIDEVKVSTSPQLQGTLQYEGRLDVKRHPATLCIGHMPTVQKPALGDIHCFILNYMWNGVSHFVAVALRQSAVALSTDISAPSGWHLAPHDTGHVQTSGNRSMAATHLYESTKIYMCQTSASPCHADHVHKVHQYGRAALEAGAT